MDERYEIAVGLIATFIIFFGAVLGLGYFVDEYKKFQAELDSKSRFVSVSENGVKTVTDKETGCKYIQSTWDTALTPMLDTKGQPVCGSRVNDY